MYIFNYLRHRTFAIIILKVHKSRIVALCGSLRSFAAYPVTGYSEYEVHIHQHTERTRFLHPAGMCCCKRKQNPDTAGCCEDLNTITCLCCLMYRLQSPVPKFAVYKVWKGCHSLNRSAALTGQAVSLTEKEQESSSPKSTGENVLGFTGLRLIWQTEIATRCDLALGFRNLWQTKRGLCRMPNDIEHMEFASFNVYQVSSSAFTMGIKTMLCPGNKDT